MILVCVFLFLLFSSSDFAFSKDSDLKFDHLTIENGLSDNYIQCILQDNRNFIWFGTNDGLDVYDGYEFKIFKNNSSDSNSISGNVIFQILEDSQNNIWIATDNGLDLYERDFNRFKHIPFIDSNMVRNQGYTRDIAKDKDGNIFASSSSNIYIFQKDISAFVPYFQNIEEFTSFQKEGIECLIIDQKNRIWVGSQTFGLFAYDLKNKKIITSPLAKSKIDIHESIFSISENKNGDIWIGTDGNLFIIKTELSGEFKVIKVKEDFSRIYKIYFDSNNRSWIGTNKKGLIRFDENKGIYEQYTNDINDPYSLGYNNIRSIYEDVQGILWLGTYSTGISYIKPYNSRKFEHYKNDPTNQFSAYNQITAIFKDTKENLWVGTDGGGLYCKINNTNEKKHFEFNPDNPNSISGNSILTINEDKSGNIWIGGYLMGISIIDNQTGRIIKLIHDDNNANSLNNNDVRYIYFDSDNIAWIATNGGGLNVYNPVAKKFTHYSQENSNIISNWCINITEDKSGNIWIGTYNGISVFERKTKTFRNYDKNTNSPKLSHNWIYSFAHDSSDNIWIGTANGLNYFNTKTESFSDSYNSDMIHNLTINGILIDKNNNLWISSNNGIYKYNYLKNEIKNFDYHDGLQGNQFIHGSYFQSKSGIMYFGGLNGYNYFYPDSIKENKHKPPVYITNLLVFYEEAGINAEGSPLNKSISELQELTLTHKQSIITFKYTALNFISPEKNQYKYLLEGFDENWNDVGTRREATYTNLDPGTYLFKLKASNNDGVWNEEGISLKIIVLPPWWKTLFFKILLFIVILAILLSIYFVRIKALSKQKIQLEKLVKERTKEIESKNIILEQQTHFLNETNTLLEERQQLIQEQTEELRTQSEELSEKNKSLKTLNITKDKFFSIIAHDLKSPFNSILGFAEYLLKNYDDLEDTNKKEYLTFVYSSAQRIFKLLENLLEWARTQTGNISFKPEHIELKDIVKNNIEIVKDAIEEKNITLINNIPQDIKVFADKNMINTVLRNLLSNAIKFTENGEIRINALCKNKYCECSITDTGVGMSEEKLTKLFAIDHAKSTEGTRGEAGTGLGLIICKEFIEKNFGTLTVSSKEGEGTTFTFSLPLQ